MLSHRKYLLIIDDAPKDSQLEDYFTQFDYQIVYSQRLDFWRGPRERGTGVYTEYMTEKPLAQVKAGGACNNTKNSSAVGIQHSQLFQLDSNTESTAAILINCSLIQLELTMINKLYHCYHVPLIMISDTANEELCVRMLEAGADDFLVKPIHPRELHARIGAINRRVQRSTKESDQEKDILTFASWRLCPASRQIFDENQQELQLSVGEYDLLLAFVRQPQRILNREFLLNITKSCDLNPLDRRIDVQISRLRQKIETDAKRPALIKTIRNGGYLFTSPVLSIKE